MNYFLEEGKKVDKLISDGRLLSAKRTFQRILKQYPDWSFLLNHQYAEFMLKEVGNGEEARRRYQCVIDDLENAVGTSDPTILADMELSACRMLMFLSLSYSEYYSWSDRFLKLKPEDRIELDNRAIVQAREENSDPWLSILLNTALSVFDGKDLLKGQPALSQGVIQLILANRRPLRISLDIHLALMRYCHIAAGTNFARNVDKQRQAGIKLNPEEVEPIRAGIRPFFQEYVQENPDDPAIKDYGQWTFTADFLPKDDEEDAEVSINEPNENGLTRNVPWGQAFVHKATAIDGRTYYELVNEEGEVIEYLPESKENSLMAITMRLPQELERKVSLRRPLPKPPKSTNPQMSPISEKRPSEKKKPTANANEMVELAIKLAKGEGIQKDVKKALELYRSAAALGNAKAQNILGVRYENGDGVAKDLSEALRLYQLAAGQGNVLAQYNLGRLYEHGQGVVKDFNKAEYWYRLAAAQGYEQAIVSLRMLRSTKIMPGCVLIVAALAIITIILYRLFFK